MFQSVKSLSFKVFFILPILCTISACGDQIEELLLSVDSNIDVRINEVVALNRTFENDAKKTPDWLELYNSSDKSISLDNWTLSDDVNDPSLWTFPENTSIPAKGYLIVWASGDGIGDTGLYRTYITKGDTFNYLVPEERVGFDWTTLTYNDDAWSQGGSGFGYGDDDDATMLPIGATSVFLRKKFTATNIAAIQYLILDIDYDDGFVAYINGHQIARSNIKGLSPSFDTVANVGHEANLYRGSKPRRFIITGFSTYLNEGDNLFSVQVHNRDETDNEDEDEDEINEPSDLSVIPFLSASYTQPSSDGRFPPSILKFSASEIHTNFKISSKGETLFLHNSAGLLVDSLIVENIPNEASIGRSASHDAVVYYPNPSPGKRNSYREYSGYVDAKVVFSDPGGITNIQEVSLSGAGQFQVIRYTLDATLPTANSSVYSAPIALQKNTVVRARIFQSGKIPSKTQTHTYLLDAPDTIPVISLVTEPDNFFDADRGIYALGNDYYAKNPYWGANFWSDKETDIHFTFYETNGDFGVEFDAGVKIFGGWSRAHPQRSLSIFARSRYGTKEMEYPFFPQLDYTKFQALVLRNSGNDWMRFMSRDAALTSLMDGSGLETQAYRPVSVYLNGEYWGFYNLREKVNEHFLASKAEVKTKDIDLLAYEGEAVVGDNTEYRALADYIEKNDLSDAEHYQYVEDRVDIDNFIIYQIAQIYFENRDWPANNIKFWKTPETKWRWILYDTDHGFGIWSNTDYLNDSFYRAIEDDITNPYKPPWSTMLLRKLSKNTVFKNKLINRFADEMNSRFLPSHVSQHIDNVASVMAAEVPREVERWKDYHPTRDDGTLILWSDELENMKNFGELRPAVVKGFLKDNFDLPAVHEVTVENEYPDRGYVQLNSLEVSGSVWSGDYFEDVPIILTAIPKSGYVFSEWKGGVSLDKATITLNLTEARTIEAVFIVEN